MLTKIDTQAHGAQWSLCLRDQADVSVHAEIFKLHEYRIIDEVIRNAVCPIIDVGAHAGFFTLYARSLNKDVEIFALEPAPANLEALRGHVSDNQVSGVQIVPAALAGVSGKRHLVLSADSHNHYLQDMYAEPVNSSLVAAYSFADFVGHYDIKKISLLKMDIEGGEYEVFDSISESDLSMVANIFLEYHVSREKSKEIEEKLRISGFGVQVFPSKFDKTMGFIFANNKRNAR